MVDANFKSTIYVKNLVETSAVPVTPVLYLSNGKQFALTPLQLAPGGIAVIDVNEALQNQSIAPYATLTGYVELQYFWPWDPICATIRNLDTLHSLIFDYGARSTKSLQFANQPPLPPGPRPITAEGMWWKQEPNVTGFVTLANTTVRTLTARLDLTDSQGSDFAHDTVTISPHGTKLIELNELLSAPTSEGGIRVSYEGSENDLIISGGLQDQTNGYSASLHLAVAMALPPATSVSVAELGLMNGPADPMLGFPAGIVFTPYSVLRNASPAPLVATPTFWWMAAGTAHSAQLPALTLHAGETRMLDVPGMLTAAGLKNFSGSGSLVFDIQGDPAGLLMAGGSVDQKYSYVFGVVPRGVKVSAAKNLSYWSVGNGDDTMVTLWNAADEAQDLIFRLMFEGGHYDFPIHLGPRATQMFNISEIVRSQLPDVEGNVVPAGIIEGSAELMGAQGEVDSMLVAMEAGIYNVKKETCGGYSCETCNGVTNASVNPSSFTIAVGDTTQLTFTETWNTGWQYGESGNWSSYNSSVAEVNSSGLVTGMDGGSTTIGVQDQYYEPTYTPNFCGYNLPSCPVQPPTPPGAQASGTVAAPTNFTILSQANLSDGSFFFRYTWSSTSGNKGDIAKCSIGESVFYPNFPNTPYIWPLPMVSQTINPTVPTPYGHGNDAEMQDTNYPPNSYDSAHPYFASSFNAIQRFWWSCPGYKDGSQQNFVPDITITRNIFKDADNFWKYQISKSNYTNTIKLPNQ